MRDKQQVIDDLSAKAFPWRVLYNLTVSKEAQIIHCPHCDQPNKIGVLYRNYAGCRECVPHLVRKDVGSYITRRKTVDQAIEQNVPHYARRVRLLTYHAWYDAFMDEHKLRPCRYAIRNFK